MDEAGGVDEDEEVLGRDDEVGWEVRESGNEVDDMGGEDARFGSGEGVFPGFGDRQERLGLNDFGVASEDLRWEDRWCLGWKWRIGRCWW